MSWGYRSGLLPTMEAHECVHFVTIDQMITWALFCVFYFTIFNFLPCGRQDLVPRRGIEPLH